MFTKDSALVKIWVKYIKKGIYTIDDVPTISNLKDVVQEALEV